MKKEELYSSWFSFIIGLYLLICWIVNLVQFFNLDFEPNYKDEVIHGLGIFIAPLSGITVWF